MKRVIAVVLNWNGPDDIIACVNSLRASGYEALDIVVVDNASTDDSVKRFRSEIPGVPLLIQPSNGGYAMGNNAGIKYALARDADFVLVINNDVVVRPGFLEPMLEEMVADPAVGIVTCDARFQSDMSRSYPTGGSISRVLGAGVTLPRRKRDRRTTVDFVSGCILLIRREVFEKLGLFDESFFMYFEDVEFSMRVGRMFRMVYTPNATVYHRSGGGDTWATQTPTYLYYMARNRFIAFRGAPAAYRAYLLMPSAVAVLAKSVAIAWHAVRNGSSRQASGQLKALWTGFLAGVKTLAAPPVSPDSTTNGTSHG